MRMWALLAALALLVRAGAAHAAEIRPLDAILAEIGGALVGLSDITLARGLGLFGLEPSDGPVTHFELERYIDGQLGTREAVQLAIDVPATDVDRAWQAAGGEMLDRRLEALGIDRGWARRLVEADLRGQRLIELRFRAFVFVTEADVEEALGPAPHDETARALTRKRLEAESLARSLAVWRKEARGRVRIRHISVGGPWPAPFSLRTP
jgi:hypothetical protein